MKTISYLTSIFVMAAILASCSKGEQGPAGPAGTNGTANINVYSVTVDPGEWNEYNSVNWYYNTNITASTSDMVNVYFTLGSAPIPAYVALPYVGVFNGTDELWYNFNTGYYIQLNYFADVGGTISSANPPDKTVYFNVAIIPPAIQVKYPNVNWKNAAEVTQLPEYKAALAKIK